MPREEHIAQGLADTPARARNDERFYSAYSAVRVAEMIEAGLLSEWPMEFTRRGHFLWRQQHPSVKPYP